MANAPQPAPPAVMDAGSGFPSIPADVRRTAGGVAYLQTAGVHLIARTRTRLDAAQRFFDGFPADLGFSAYPDDPVEISPGAQLCKTAGQLCYLSFGPRRTTNAEADRYFDNIRDHGHGSVLEHASVSLLLSGVSRSLTHELVRHRAGFAFSQVSQRYVGYEALRFVERPEYQSDDELHRLFEARIERIAAEYSSIAAILGAREAGTPDESRTDRRKRLQQTARSVLPNETEAPIIVTANMRAWRHFIEMRGSAHAETEIRALAYRVFLLLTAIEPLLFADYEVAELADGSPSIRTPQRKV